MNDILKETFLFIIFIMNQNAFSHMLIYLSNLRIFSILTYGSVLDDCFRILKNRSFCGKKTKEKKKSPQPESGMHLISGGR